MASVHEIMCINKDDRNNPYERITHVGGKNANGAPWNVTQKAAIEGIKGGHWEFYVTCEGRTVNVVVAASRYGNKYLKTEADGEEPNNLLSLVECHA